MTPCVEWTGCRDKDGYGVGRLDGRKQPAHRVAWQQAHGPIPVGLLVLHRCDNPPCINVEHLFLGKTHGMYGRDGLRGERNGNAKLTDAQAAEIASRITGAYGELIRLAAEYGVSVSLVRKIKHGERRVIAA